MAYENYPQSDRERMRHSRDGRYDGRPDRRDYTTDDLGYDRGYYGSSARRQDEGYYGMPYGGRYSSSMVPGPGPYPDERDRSGGRGFWDKAGDEVASWFGDDDAERRREADQHRGKGPKGYQRSDGRINEDVSDRLTDDPFLDATEISVSVADGEVTLDGTVEQRSDKRRAEDCADSVSGVKHVQNNIRVRPSGASEAATASQM